MLIKPALGNGDPIPSHAATVSLLRTAAIFLFGPSVLHIQPVDPSQSRTDTSVLKSQTCGPKLRSASGLPLAALRPTGRPRVIRKCPASIHPLRMEDHPRSEIRNKSEYDPEFRTELQFGFRTSDFGFRIAPAAMALGNTPLRPLLRDSWRGFPLERGM